MSPRMAADMAASNRSMHKKFSSCIRFLPLSACALFTLWAHHASATIAKGELENFEYGELMLVRTILSGKVRLACFVTPQHKPVWAHQGDYVGKQFGQLADIAEKAVTVKEKLLVNYGEWIERSFTWPIGHAQGLSELCANPPAR